ncbi:MAG: helix-turn-helix domain-containing protein [Mangrovibacterium sp.]
MEKIGNIIKERRKILSITQRELAALSGVGINTLTKIERGEANPSLKIVINILNTLGLEMDIKIKTNKA